MVTAGTATTPVFSGTGDGSMSTVTTSATTKTESWTVQNKTTAGAVTRTGTGDGSVVDINVIKSNGPSEKWTLTCNSAGTSISAVTGTAISKGTVTGISVTGASATETQTFTLTCKTAGILGIFEVRGSKNGLYTGDATAGTPYTSVTPDTGLSFTIGPGSTAYAVGETLIFTSTVGGTFSVLSSVAGYYPDATVGTAYQNSAISFQINQGPILFIVGDTLEFTTTTAWQVVGTVSGAQTNSATTGTAYTSDNSEVAFTITEGATAFVEGDKFSFSTTVGLTYWTVVGTVSGTQTNRAYNGQGYYSDGNEVYFLITAGTTAFANGDTFTFTVTASELTYGWTVWDMVKAPDTHGATAILYAATAVGVYKSTDGAKTWSSLTSFTGDYIIALGLYPTATGGASDIIYAGTQNGGVWVSTNSGSTWTQDITGMDEGKGATIKDLLVDPDNDRLYAIVYKGPVENATGNLYVHTLNSNGTMATGEWSKANTGLSGTALYAPGSKHTFQPHSAVCGGGRDQSVQGHKRPGHRNPVLG